MKGCFFKGRLMLLLFGLMVGLLAPVTLGSCRSQKTIVESNTNSDLLYTQFQMDSLTTLAADDARAALIVYCDSNLNAHIEAFDAESGKRIKLELMVKELFQTIDTLQGESNTYRRLWERSESELTKERNKNNTPLYIEVACHEDSLNRVIEVLRTEVEQYKQEVERVREPIEVPPSDYGYKTNCTKGFWWLLITDILIIALLIIVFVGRKLGWWDKLKLLKIFRWFM